MTDPTEALSDDELDSLAERVARRLEANGELDSDDLLSRMSRRGFLAAVGGAAGVGALAGGASADPNTSNAAGSAGTENKPFTDVWAVDGHFDSVNTDELSNVYDHICHDSADLATALEDLASGGFTTIWLAPKTFTPFDNLTQSVVDISDAGGMIHGPGGKPSKETANPLEYFDAAGGAIIDCNGSQLFTGNRVRGLSLEGFYLKNYGDGAEGAAIDIGEQDVLGAYDVHVERVTGPNGGDNTLLSFTNIQGVSIKHCYAPETKRVLNIENFDGRDNDTAGANSIVQDVFCQLPSDWTGDKPDGGIRISATDSFLNFLTLIRPQVNYFAGNDNTGTNILIDSYVDGSETTTSDDDNSKGLVLLDADCEGFTKHSILGRSVVQSMIRTATSHGEYAVKLEQGDGVMPVANEIHINGVASAKGTGIAHSPNGRNQLFGEVGDVTGDWYGLAHNNADAELQQYIGRDVNTFYVSWDQTTTFNGIGVDVDHLKMDLDNLSGNPGDEKGEVRRNNGDSRLYEWDGASWQQLTGSNTITP
ncbi:hypothetical protein Hbl1158_16920 (plasmid) [Halobaculum sp. CBA1158]|uniref:hypothetical protein n=1 Tax=Halobaculum sp. CBA1158 TaxID=2904243 RepID=UPI001F16396F|nr:hypothetical protein [Halobaculum sp. CBA1158]UIP01737.1 hypothetical protein Hbl1158_16920 [Halobaculum sp. CBA1158]